MEREQFTGKMVIINEKQESESKHYDFFVFLRYIQGSE